MKRQQAMKPLVLKFPAGMLDEIDATRAVDEGLMTRSEFIREATRCLTHLPPEHLWLLQQYSLKEEIGFPRLIREAVALYVEQKRDELDRAVRGPGTERPRNRKGKSQAR